MKDYMEKRALSGLFLHFAIGSALVLASYGLSDLVRDYLHPQVLFDLFGAFTLIYLPHGVMLLLAWFYGWMAVPIMLPASFVAVLLLRGTAALEPMILTLLVLKVVAAPLAFDLFRLGGIDARGPGQGLNWRVLFLIGLVQSMFSNQARFWLGCCGDLSANQLLMAFAGSVIGDMAGLLVIMMAAMFFFRALRQG